MPVQNQNGRLRIKDITGPAFYDEAQPDGTPWANLSDAHSATAYRHLGDKRYVENTQTGKIDTYKYTGITDLENQNISSLKFSGTVGEVTSVSQIEVDFDYIGVKASNTGIQNRNFLQAFIDDMVSANTQGVLIKAGPGTFKLENTLNQYKGIKIIGCGVGLKGDAEGSIFSIEDTVNSPFALFGDNELSKFAFNYPAQPLLSTNPGNIIDYPYTIKFGKDNVRNIKLSYLTEIGSTGFINFDPEPFFNSGTSQYTFPVWEDAEIHSIYGYPLKNSLIKLRHCYDIPRISNVHNNPGVGKNGIRQLNSSTGLGISNEIIHAVIETIGGNIVDLYKCDEFEIRNSFFYGSKCGVRLQDSYGSIVQTNFDISETGVHATLTGNRILQMLGCNGFFCGGTVKANKNAILIDGDSGRLNVVGGGSAMGVGTVTGNTGDANAFLKVTGTNQTIKVVAVNAGINVYDYDIQDTGSNNNITVVATNIQATNHYYGESKEIDIVQNLAPAGKKIYNLNNGTDGKLRLRHLNDAHTAVIEEVFTTHAEGSSFPGSTRFGNSGDPKSTVHVSGGVILADGAVNGDSLDQGLQLAKNILFFNHADAAKSWVVESQDGVLFIYTQQGQQIKITRSGTGTNSGPGLKLELTGSNGNMVLDTQSYSKFPTGISIGTNTYADNAAALAANEQPGTVYRKTAGGLDVVTP